MARWRELRLALDGMQRLMPDGIGHGSGFHGEIYESATYLLRHGSSQSLLTQPQHRCSKTGGRHILCNVIIFSPSRSSHRF